MKKICDLLEFYLSDRLSEEEKIVFEKHLKKCDACYKEVEAYNRIGEYLDSIPKVNVPENFSAQVMEKIYRAKERIYGWYVYSALLAVFLVASVFVVEMIGFEQVTQKAYFLFEALTGFASSVSTAVITLSDSLYNSVNLGRFNGVVLTVVFAGLCFVFLKSVKLFASSER